MCEHDSFLYKGREHPRSLASMPGVLEPVPRGYRGRLYVLRQAVGGSVGSTAVNEVDK